MAIKYLIPVQESNAAQANLAPRLKSLDGARIGLLSNRKTNADELLTMIAEELGKEFQFGGIVHSVKGNAGGNCPEEIMDDLLAKSDAVITGLGDWGSCSSCSLHDGIEIDTHGKPAAALITKPFIPTAKAIAQIRNIPDYEFVILDHPLGSLKNDELRERARAAVPQIKKILCE